jgi:hypothetical protein
MKEFSTAMSCVSSLVRLGIALAGMFIMFNAGIDKFLDEPLYAMTVLIFYYLLFSEQPAKAE